MIPRTLAALLAARAQSPVPALIERGRAISYGSLADESRRVAHGLTRLGLRPGDRVALWLPNVPAWLATFFACAQIGAIAVSVNARFRSHELADLLARSRARVLLFWPGFKGIDFAGLLAACGPGALEHLESLVLYDESGSSPPDALIGKRALAYAALAGGAPMFESRAEPSAGCVIFTTSGTTNAPKFVLYDQRTVVAHAFDVARGFDIGNDSVMLLAPPLCGVFGFCSAMAAIAAGLAPVAFVLLHPGAAFDEPSLIAHVASRLARYKVPLRVFPIDAFPVTPGANATKIQKGKLRELAEALLN